MKITYFETKIAWYTPSRLQTPFLWLVPSTLHNQKEHQQLAKHQQQQHHQTVATTSSPPTVSLGSSSSPCVMPLLWFPPCMSPASGTRQWGTAPPGLLVFLMPGSSQQGKKALGACRIWNHSNIHKQIGTILPCEVNSSQQPVLLESE